MTKPPFYIPPKRARLNYNLRPCVANRGGLPHFFSSHKNARGRTVWACVDCGYVARRAYMTQHRSESVSYVCALRRYGLMYAGDTIIKIPEHN